MRLINAHTLKLEEVWDETVEQYAILSHRWENAEVSFHDMQDSGRREVSFQDLQSLKPKSFASTP